MKRILLQKRILKKYKLETKYQPRIVFTTEADYDNSVKRNGISIEARDGYDSFEELMEFFRAEKEAMSCKYQEARISDR